MIDYKLKYNEYLKSEKWANKRQQVALREHWTCQKCGKVILTNFHIHHKSYKHFGDEPLDDLMFLCENCHTNIHCGIKAKKYNKSHKKKQKKCENCYFSQLERYKNSKISYGLYCNKNMDICEDVCRFYRRGEEKKIPKRKQKHR